MSLFFFVLGALVLGGLITILLANGLWGSNESDRSIYGAVFPVGILLIIVCFGLFLLTTDYSSPGYAQTETGDSTDGD